MGSTGGSGERRCELSSRRCDNDASNECQFFSKSNAYLRLTKTGCSIFSRQCSGDKFCGITKQGIAELATPSFRACFAAEGGYADVPEWYNERDFRDRHRCIDEAMKTEMDVCLEQVRLNETAIRVRFRDGMNECARRHGKRNFAVLMRGCNDADVLSKMRACANDVEASIAATVELEPITQTPPPVPPTLVPPTLVPPTLVPPTLPPPAISTPAPRANCGVPGGSRRRCPAPPHSTGCKNRPDDECHYTTTQYGLPPPPQHCRAFESTCGFCGVTEKELELLASVPWAPSVGDVPYNRTALSCCFGRVGGYLRTPGWYQYGHYMDPDRCISGEMAAELAQCKQEANEEAENQKARFISLMDTCAQQKNYPNFADILESCGEPDKRAAAEACKASVLSQMTAARA